MNRGRYCLVEVSSKCASAAAAEFCAGGIGNAATRAQHFNRSWRRPGDLCAAESRAAFTTELCAPRLIHAAARATNVAARCRRDGTVQTWARSNASRRRRRAGALGRYHIERRVAAAPTELCAGRESRAAFRARHNCGRLDVNTRDTAETSTF